LFSKLTAFAVCIALLLSLTACMDSGAGENEDDFKKYFSGVYVVTKQDAKKYSIEKFNEDISIEDMDIPVVVPYEEYCYIGFKVDEQYTVSLSEFAFFVKTEEGRGTLDLEFYIVDNMPSSIKNDDGNDVKLPTLDSDETLPTAESAQPKSAPTTGEGETQSESETESQGESDTQTETEIYEEEVFVPSSKFHSYTFSIDEEWDSVLLQFDEVKTVNPGQYIVVRIKNNCYSATSEEEVPTAVSFTFNYLMFYFNDARKK
jgi:hypothetical protein